METLRLQIEGMSCNGCEQRISRVLRRVEGARDVTADHTTGRVEVVVVPEPTDRAALAERINAAGYQVLTAATKR